MLYCTFTVLKYSATLLSLLPIASKGWEYSTKINFPTILLNKNYFLPPHKKKIFFANIFAHFFKFANIFAHLRNYRTFSQTFSQLYDENIYIKICDPASQEQILKPCEHFRKHCKHICNTKNICEILQTSSKPC